MEKVFENKKFLVEISDGEGLAKNELRITVKPTRQTLFLDADRTGTILTGANGQRFHVSLYIGDDPEQMPWLKISPGK